MHRRRLHHTVALALVTVVYCTAALARADEPVFEAERAATFDAAMTAALAEQELVGLAVAVFENGELAHVAGYGVADRETERPVSARTLFRWASVSKPVTAVAALQLAEQNKLDLTETCGRYWRSLPDGLSSVPVDALLRHQGGVGHYREMGSWQARLDSFYPGRVRKPWDAERSVRVLDEPPVLFEPYAQYHYTTFGYNLLGAIVEKAGRAPFEALVEKRIAKRLGMTTFEPDYEFRDRPGRTRGYRKVGEEIVPSQPGDVSWKLPGGGFHSTVGDMARFGIGLLGEELLTASSKAKMFDVRQPQDGETSYALGIGVATRNGTPVRVSHSGAQSRTRTLLEIDLTERRGLAIMTNSEWGDPRRISRAARKALSW